LSILPIAVVGSAAIATSMSGRAWAATPLVKVGVQLREGDGFSCENDRGADLFAQIGIG